MKKLMLSSITVCMLLTINPLKSEASVNAPSASVSDSSAIAVAEIKSLLFRLEEIKAIDKSKLESAEKRELRKEVRSIRERLREVGGGVYISVGALIIIILLLILLL
ncbi:MAG: hypothetical protein ABI723_25725 [Bacteroidia bacterium]